MWPSTPPPRPAATLSMCPASTLARCSRCWMQVGRWYLRCTAQASGCGRRWPGRLATSLLVLYMLLQPQLAVQHSNAERTARPCVSNPWPGGIFVGKTNLDQFACGLVGTRTPYGVPGEVMSVGSWPDAPFSLVLAACCFPVGRSMLVQPLQVASGGCANCPAKVSSCCDLQPTSLTTASLLAVHPAGRLWLWPAGCAPLHWVPTRQARVRSKLGAASEPHAG